MFSNLDYTIGQYCQKHSPKILGCMLMFFGVPQVHAELKDTNVMLRVKPVRCVALHEGDKCHAKVKVYWESDVSGDYCLSYSRENTTLECWDNKNKGHYYSNMAFVSDVEFYLIDAHSAKTLATALLEISWLYEERQMVNQAWRLF